ncbi:MAG: AAA family ATPase [Planctomycetia bacterium]|nr:AAA family ATPase [Planctomycetia bacterium]
MIIRTIEIARFGHWRKLRISRLAEGVNVFYGPNEIGKTTLMQFIRTILFGFSEESLNYLDRQNPSECGGTLTVQTALGIFHISRYAVRQEKSESEIVRHDKLHFDEKEDVEYNGWKNLYVTRFFDDGLTVTDQRGVRLDSRVLLKLLQGEFSVSGNPLAQSIKQNEVLKKDEDGGSENLTRNNLLRKDNISSGDVRSGELLPEREDFLESEWSLLEGVESAQENEITLDEMPFSLTDQDVDSSLFFSIFAIGLRELQQLTILDSTRAAALLYQLSTGLQRHSLHGLLRQVQKDASLLLKPDDRISDLRLEESAVSGYSSFLSGLSGDYGKILQEIYKRELLQKEIETCVTRNENYPQMLFRKKELTEDIQAQKHHLEQILYQVQLLKIAEKIRPIWQQRTELDEKIVVFQRENLSRLRVSFTYGMAHDLQETETFSRRSVPEEETLESLLLKTKKYHEKLITLQTKITQKNELSQRLREKGQKLLGKIKSLKIYPELLGLIPRMEAILVREERIETLKTRVSALQRSVTEIHTQLKVDYRRLRLPFPKVSLSAENEIKKLYSLGTLRSLRIPLRDVHAVQKRLHNERRQYKEYMSQSETAQRKIEEYLVEARQRLLASEEVSSEILQNIFMHEISDVPKYGTVLERKSQESFSEVLSESGETPDPASDVIQEKLYSDVVPFHGEIPVHGEIPAVDVLAQKLGVHASKLRRRDRMLSQLQQMEQTFLSTEEALQNLRKKRILSRPVLTAVGIFFIGGLTLMLFSMCYLFGWLSTQMPGIYMFPFLLGTASWGAALYFKIHHDWKFHRTLEDLVSQQKKLVRQKTQAISACFPEMVHQNMLNESEETKLLPALSDMEARKSPAEEEKSARPELENFSDSEEMNSGSGMTYEKNDLCREEVTFQESDVIIKRCESEREALRKALDVLQKEITLAEEKSLLASRAKALRLEAEHSKKRIKKLRKDLFLAEERRREALIKLSLPEKWKTKDIKNLLRHVDRLLEMWRRLERDMEDLQRIFAELSLFSDNVSELLDEMGDEVMRTLPPVSKISEMPEVDPFIQQQSSPKIFEFTSSLFPAIREKIAQQLRLQEQKKEMIKDFRNIRNFYRKNRVDLTKLNGQRQFLLYHLSVEDEKDLEVRIQMAEDLNNLYQKRREIQKNLDEMINFHASETAIWEIYEKYEPQQLTSRIQILQQRQAVVEAECQKKQKEMDSLEIEIRHLEMDDRLVRLRSELVMTENRILEGIRQWRSLVLTYRLMEVVKKTYEQKRQPRTLRVASRYFRQMTKGKYLRVWTPLDEDILLVDCEDKTVFTVQQLSSGTRELLFLALRLALIEGYRRKNIQLPVIFDDILVNFDQKRVQAAADVLCQFSQKEHFTSLAAEVNIPVQIFVFTCHEHIRDVFEKDGVMIRNLRPPVTEKITGNVR